MNAQAHPTKLQRYRNALGSAAVACLTLSKATNAPLRFPRLPRRTAVWIGATNARPITINGLSGYDRSSTPTMRVLIMRLVMLLVLTARCMGVATPTSPAIQRDIAPTTPYTPPSATPPPPNPHLECTVLPQPSAPTHTTVEPNDMICTHGETVLECPTGAAVALEGCRSIGLRRWCCPSS